MARVVEDRQHECVALAVEFLLEQGGRKFDRGFDIPVEIVFNVPLLAYRRVPLPIIDDFEERIAGPRIELSWKSFMTQAYHVRRAPSSYHSYVCASRQMPLQQWQCMASASGKKRSLPAWSAKALHSSHSTDSTGSSKADAVSA